MTDTVNDSTRQPAPTSTTAADVLAVRHSRTVDTSAEFTAASDTIVLGRLPKGHVPVDLIIDADPLDSDGTPAVLFKVGITGDDDCFIASTNVAQAGGIARMSNVDGLRVPASDSDRDIILTCLTPPDADLDGIVGCTLFYKAKPKV